MHPQPERFAVATGSTPPAGYLEVARLAELDWRTCNENGLFHRSSDRPPTDTDAVVGPNVDRAARNG